MREERCDHARAEADALEAEVECPELPRPRRGSCSSATLCVEQLRRSVRERRAGRREDDRVPEKRGNCLAEAGVRGAWSALEGLGRTRNDDGSDERDAERRGPAPAQRAKPEAAGSHEQEEDGSARREIAAGEARRGRHEREDRAGGADEPQRERERDPRAADAQAGSNSDDRERALRGVPPSPAAGRQRVQCLLDERLRASVVRTRWLWSPTS